MIERRLIADLLIELNRKKKLRRQRETVKQVVASTSTRYSFRDEVFMDKKSCEKNREVSSKYLNVVF